jgi:hypothetical protein
MSGVTVNSWLVLKRSDVRKQGAISWDCKCLLCGRVYKKTAGQLNSPTGGSKCMSCSVRLRLEKKYRTHSLGRKKFTLSELAAIAAVPYETIGDRIRRGDSVESAVSTPGRPKASRKSRAA